MYHRKSYGHIFVLLKNLQELRECLRMFPMILQIQADVNAEKLCLETL